MSAQHTPGPWRCVEAEFGEYQTGKVAFVVDASPQMFASVANCRLIAAAPELLAACKLWEAYQHAIDSDDPKVSRPLNAYGEAMDATLAAIAKATGSAA